MELNSACSIPPPPAPGPEDFPLWDRIGGQERQGEGKKEGMSHVGSGVGLQGPGPPAMWGESVGLCIGSALMFFGKSK